jgi:formyl-CoA transferase
VHARGKRLITLDLRSEAGQDLFLQLVACSDVVVENFRPGTLERWNLGYDRLAETNPGLVLARVSGYGQTGPYREQAGYASVAEAMGGLRYITGHPSEAPPRMGISLGDSLAGMFALQGILAALHWRDRSGGDGRGQVVDVSLLESCLALLESTLPEYDRLGLVRQPSGSRLPGVAPSNVFCTSDDRWIVIAANQDTLFRRLAAAMDRPELADDPRYATHDARGENQEELEQLVAEWARDRTGDDIVRVLGAAGVVCGPVYTAADIAADPQVRARDMLVPHDDDEIGTFLGPGVVPKLSATPGGVRWSGKWEPGTHNAEVYGELLGLEGAQLDELAKAGTV